MAVASASRRLRIGSQVRAFAPFVGLALIVLIAVFGPFLTQDSLAQDLKKYLVPPTRDNLLGTDDLGRDLLSRLILGTRLSLVIGFGSAAIALVVGGTLGMWAGYGAGLVSATIMRCSDVLLAFPAVLLAMLVATIFKTGMLGVIPAIAIVSIPTFVRLANAMMLSQRHLQFVEAAVAFGAAPGYVIFRSVLPNVVGPLAVQTAFTIANAVLLEAGLSFLGLGIQPPTPSLGLILQDARGFIRTHAWYGIFPGLILIVIVLCLNGVADAIARRLDRRSLAARQPSL
jgi:ABC-type dipeptide/oligopeptide/nickel transport system permease subunit